MARERIVKSTPKRGKLLRRQVRRVVREVIQKRRERESTAATAQLRQVATNQVGCDAKTDKFMSRQKVEHKKKTAVVETTTLQEKTN